MNIGGSSATLHLCNGNGYTTRYTYMVLAVLPAKALGIEWKVLAILFVPHSCSTQYRHYRLHTCVHESSISLNISEFNTYYKYIEKYVANAKVLESICNVSCMQAFNVTQTN